MQLRLPAYADAGPQGFRRKLDRPFEHSFGLSSQEKACRGGDSDRLFLRGLLIERAGSISSNNGLSSKKFRRSER
jgi:hypothetical protein